MSWIIRLMLGDLRVPFPRDSQCLCRRYLLVSQSWVSSPQRTVQWGIRSPEDLVRGRCSSGGGFTLRGAVSSLCHSREDGGHCLSGRIWTHKGPHEDRVLDVSRRSPTTFLSRPVRVWAGVEWHLNGNHVLTTTPYISFNVAYTFGLPPRKRLFNFT